MSEQSIEKEFKCLLSKKAYQKGLNRWMTALSPLRLQNVYYDWEGRLSKADKALRIRLVNDEAAELTLKENIGPNEKRETTIPLTVEEAKDFIAAKRLTLPRDLRAYLNQQGLPLVELEEKVSFSTCRYEKEVNEALIVLDQVFFSDESSDYELECEVTDLTEGKVFFQTLLEDLATPYQPAPNKLARALAKKKLAQ